VIWYDLRDSKDPQLDELAARYNLHPLHVEDVRHGRQRAKVEEGDGYLFVVLKPVQVNKDCDLTIADLGIFLGSDFLITITDGPFEFLDEVKKRAEGQRSDQLFYKIFDSLVDAYLPILDAYGDSIDEIEDLVLAKPDPDTLQRIFTTKRSLIELRRVLENTRDIAGHLQRTETELIQRDLWPFLRDVYDHLARNLDLVEMQRDLLSGTLDIYLSSVANRTNQVMKVLTILGTVALPSIVVSGFFGMNTKDLPWTQTPHGTWYAVGLMLASTAILLAMLKKFDWW
jgi:magnesium transporter